MSLTEVTKNQLSELDNDALSQLAAQHCTEEGPTTTSRFLAGEIFELSSSLCFSSDDMLWAPLKANPNGSFQRELLAKKYNLAVSYREGTVGRPLSTESIDGETLGRNILVGAVLAAQEKVKRDAVPPLAQP